MNVDLTAGIPSWISVTQPMTTTTHDATGAFVEVAPNTARFDYDPTTLLPRGLVLEAASTNSTAYSDDITAYPPHNIATPTGVTTNPRASAANLIQEGTGTGQTADQIQHYDYHLNDVLYLSCVAQRFEGNLSERFLNIRPTRAPIQPGGPGMAVVSVNFDIETGVVAGTVGAITGGIEPAGPDAWRCWIRAVASNGELLDSHWDLILSATTQAGGASYTGDGTSGMYLSRIHSCLNFLSYPIPTASAAVTKPADVATLDLGSQGYPDGVVILSITYSDLSTSTLSIVVNGGLALLSADMLSGPVISAIEVTQTMTTDFNLNAAQIVTEAFGRLGIGQEGEALTPRMLSDGLTALNLLIKSYGAQEHLWTLSEGSLALVASQASYTITPKPMRVLSVRRRINGIDTPLNMFSRQEYFDQPNKTGSPSTPVNFYYDPQQATGTLYVWPAPSTTTASTTTLQYTFLRRMADIDAATNDLDMPQEWLEAVVYNLAARLMPQYPVNDPNQAKLVIGMAAQLYSDLQGWDNEPASLYLQPETRGDWYR